MEVVACIPTCLSREIVDRQRDDILRTSLYVREVYVSAHPASASVNRNDCLNSVSSDIVIMLDDDMTGFFTNWDKILIEPLLVDSDIYLVSARLMDKNGSPGAMMHNNNNYAPGWYPPKAKFVPTSCIAFRRSEIRFDEMYVGSGWEDTDWCRQLDLKFPLGKVVINNNCRLTHLNEMKNQHGENWEKNKTYYTSKWGSV